MAASINVAGLTLNPLEVDSFASFVFEQTFNRPELSKIHMVWGGIKMKEQIIFASLLSKTGIKDAACARPNSGATSVLSEKYWEPIAIGDTLINCQKDVNSLFKAYYTKIQKFSDLYDITGTDQEKFLLTIVIEAAMAAIWRLVWFGDKNVAVSGAAAAGLVLAADVKYYDSINGLWIKMFAAVLAGDLKRVTITKNAEVTTAAQYALADYEAEGIYRSMVADADPRLKTSANALILTTNSLFQNYIDGLEKKGTPYNIEITTEGLQSLKFRGYELVNMQTVWDLTMKDFEQTNAGAAEYLPHRAVFTVPNNIPVGTLNENDFSTLESFYEPVTRQNFTAWGTTLDAQILEGYMAVVAY